MVNIQPVSPNYGPNSANRIRTGQKKTAGTQSSAPESASVQISGEASDVNTVRMAMARTPEIRMEVVDKVKIRIKSNDYPIENNMDEAIKRLIQSNIVP